LNGAIQFHYIPNTDIESEYKYWAVTDDPATGRLRLKRGAVPPNMNWRHASAGYEYYFRRAADSLRAGETDDAAGFLGTLLHFIEDSTFGLHAVEGTDGVDIFVLDRFIEPPGGDLALRPSSVIDCKLLPFDIQGYQPRLLGLKPAEAAFHLYTACAEVVAAARKKLIPIVFHVYEKNEAAANALRLAMLQDSARLCADVVFTCCAMAGAGWTADQAARLQQVYLSDMKPVREPRGLSMPYRFITMLRDAALDADRRAVPLRLKIDGQETAFAKGLGTGSHYDYTLAWEIPAGVYDRFRCAVGAHSTLSPDGDFTASLTMNGRVEAEARCWPERPAARFGCGVSHGGLLELKVRSGAGMALKSNIVWGAPLLTRAPLPQGKATS
ncbi:MAG TPA: hypothetical protein P5137_01615, partial [Candidatus Brocadiia bacterium]|nr:hypothetical protein [Candidatus Brocadiia bacterium]